MTITLHLGVVDLPYASGTTPPRRMHARRNAAGKMQTASAPASGGETTGDVAHWLEDKYHVIETFYETRETAFAQRLAESARAAFETLAAGSPAVDPVGDATEWLGAEFRRFLSSGEIEGLGIPGVPTQASLGRRSSRMKSGSRTTPSFIDTGLYEQSFRAWVDR